jgi:hypothetical protein
MTWAGSRVAAERVRRGMPAKSVILVGLRGVGKTVLLDRMREDAESGGSQTFHIEAPEGRSLPALIAPQLRILLRQNPAVLSASKQNGRRLDFNHSREMPLVRNNQALALFMYVFPSYWGCSRHRKVLTLLGCLRTCTS